MSKSSDHHLELEYQKVPVAENGRKHSFSPSQTSKQNFKSSDIPESYGLGWRHIQILLAFLSLATGYITRAHLGVTVVAMTNTLHGNSYKLPTEVIKNITRVPEGNTTKWEDMYYENETSILYNDFDTDNGTAELLRKNISLPKSNGTSGIFKKYDWPKSTQEMVLGSFFFGYLIMMIPMGMVCQKYGGKLPMQIALIVNGVASIVTPWMAVWGGWKGVCACRFLQGLSQAGLYPAIQVLVAKWASSEELGRFISWAYTGSMFGTIAAFQAGGLLAAQGWPYSFWVTGALCLIMFVILTVFGAASPTDHRSISEEEKKFIMGKASGKEKKKLKVPLKAVLTSKHVLATWSTHAGGTVAFVFFYNQVPSYIHYILNVDVKKSGLLSSLPYIASFVTSIIYGFVSDFITNRNILSVKNARRLFNSYSQIGVTICFIAVSFTKNVELAILCLVAAMAINVALHTGWMVNYIDLAPNFSGSLMSFGNTISYITVSLLPFFVSFVVTDVTNQLQWRIIFISMAVLVTVTNIIFVIFLSTDVQPWNECGYEQTETEEQRVQANEKS